MLSVCQKPAQKPAFPDCLYPAWSELFSYPDPVKNAGQTDVGNRVASGTEFGPVGLQKRNWMSPIESGALQADSLLFQKRTSEGGYFQRDNFRLQPKFVSPDQVESVGGNLKILPDSQIDWLIDEFLRLRRKYPFDRATKAWQDIGTGNPYLPLPANRQNTWGRNFVIPRVYKPSVFDGWISIYLK